MRTIRKEYGITAAAMAKHLSLSVDQLNRFERGDTSLRLGPAWEFCALTSTSPYWLAFGPPQERMALGSFGSIDPAEAAALFVPRIRESQAGKVLKVVAS